MLLACVSLSAGCSQHEPPPSVEQLKEMVSRAASISVERFQTIQNMPLGRTDTIRQSPSQPLTLMILSVPFAAEERDMEVELPKTSLTRPTSNRAREIVVNILADGTLKVQGRTFTNKNLSELLKRAVGTNPDQRVLIRCDKNAKHKHLAGVIETCRRAGIDSAGICIEGFGPPAPPASAPAPIPGEEEPPLPPSLAPEDFRLLGEPGLGKAEELVNAMYGRRGPLSKPLDTDPSAYVSIIRPEYITECTRSVQGETITGKVSFRAEGLYEGTVEYTARLSPDGWRIEEFRLPHNSRRTVLTPDGTWKATTSVVSPIANSQLLRQRRTSR